MAELPKDEPMVSSVFFQQWTAGCLLEEKRTGGVLLQKLLEPILFN
jgi:hypothetical protein